MLLAMYLFIVDEKDEIPSCQLQNIRCREKRAK